MEYESTVPHGRRIGQGHEIMTFGPLVSMPLFGRPGLGEMVLILLAVLILFGGSKLPALGKGLGEGIRNFKKGLKGDEPDGDKPQPEAEKKIEKRE
jgi:sec-independent protein translocase protein TatA